MKAKAIAALAGCVIAGCGGGSDGGAGTRLLCPSCTSATSVPSYSTPAAASIEGYWLGQAAPYTTATVVLGDGTLYAIYSRAGRVEGIMTGSVGAGGNTFSASVIDYNGALLTVTPGTIGGTFSTRGELTGSIAIGSRSYTLSGSYDSSYDTPAKVADFAGAWTGTGGSRDGVATTTLTLLADGTFTGATPYCQASGSVECDHSIRWADIHVSRWSGQDEKPVRSVALQGCCQRKTLGRVLSHARPPWTSHPPTGQACGRPLRGPWLDHRSSADAFGLTRFACQTAV
jgi:hypothetical protein